MIRRAQARRAIRDRIIRLLRTRIPRRLRRTGTLLRRLRMTAGST